MLLTSNSPHSNFRTKNDVINYIEEMNKETTNNVLNNEAQVDYGEINITKDRKGVQHGSLTVTIKNKTSEIRNFTFVFVIFDKYNEHITDEIVHVNNIGPGKTKTKEIFKDLSETELSRIEGSKIRIIQAY